MRCMRVMVFFDLPVKSKKDRKAYTDFRRDLLKMGFTMVQYSIYSRTVKNSDDAVKYENLVEKIVAFTQSRGCTKVKYTIDPKIVGGIIIYIGDVIYDGSVRSRLENIKHSL